MTSGKANAPAMRRRHQELSGTSETAAPSSAWIMLVGTGQDGGVLGHGGAAKAEDQDVAGTSVRGWDFHEMAARGGEHGFLARSFGPIACVGRQRLRFTAVERAEDATDQAEAVGADTLCAGLMMIGRADPGARVGKDEGASWHEW